MIKVIKIGNIVPTRLEVRVNDTHTVIYDRLENCFGYRFEVFPSEGAKEAVEEIVLSMENQSFDHGASWRMTSLKEMPEREGDISKIFIATFRIRDSY